MESEEAFEKLVKAQATISDLDELLTIYKAQLQEKDANLLLQKRESEVTENAFTALKNHIAELTLSYKESDALLSFLKPPTSLSTCQ